VGLYVSLECGVGIVGTWKRAGLSQVMQVFAGFVSVLSIVREEGGRFAVSPSSAFGWTGCEC